MRALASVAAYLFLTALAPARCAVVEVLNVQPSAQRVRITTLRDAKPVGNVPVAVLSADEQPRFSFSTNNKGTAVLPKLSPGRYHIAATAPGGFRADLILEVTVQPGRKTSSFSMDLVLKPPPPPTMEEKIAAAENTAPAESLKVFTGFVVDPTGAALAETAIAFYPKGSRGRRAAAETRSDESGRFSVHLPAGTYTAVFRRSGFAARFFVFEIADSGESKDLRVALQLAEST
jgi:hypothetical protein